MKDTNFSESGNRVLTGDLIFRERKIKSPVGGAPDWRGRGGDNATRNKTSLPLAIDFFGKLCANRLLHAVVVVPVANLRAVFDVHLVEFGRPIHQQTVRLQRP